MLTAKQTEHFHTGRNEATQGSEVLCHPVLGGAVVKVAPSLAGHCMADAPDRHKPSVSCHSLLLPPARRSSGLCISRTPTAHPLKKQNLRRMPLCILPPGCGLVSLQFGGPEKILDKSTLQKKGFVWLAA